MELKELLAPERIRCHCECKSKKRAIQTIAELLGESLRSKAMNSASLKTSEDSTSKVDESGRRKKAPSKSSAESDPDSEMPSDMAILDALISRERLGSTGLGHGVGLPHSRMSAIDNPIAALITLQEGVDYESIDSQPVDLVLGLLVPEECNERHLQILANLAKLFEQAAFREKLREVREPGELYDYIASESYPAGTS